MSDWVNRTTGHAVWELIPTIEKLIDQGLAFDEIEANHIDALERVRTALNITQTRLKNIDPYLLDPRKLSTFQGPLQSIQSNLNSYIADKNIQHLTDANQNADDALSHLQTIFTIQTKEDLSSLSAAAAHYRGEIDKHLKHAIETHKAVKLAATENAALLQNLKESIESEKQRLIAVISDFQTQFSSGQDSRQTEFTNAQSERQNAFSTSQAERQEQFSGTASEYQQQFSTAQETRSKEFSEAEAERKEKGTALLTEYSTKLAEHNTNFTSDREALMKNGKVVIEEVRESAKFQAANMLEMLYTIKTEVERVAGVVGNVSLTSGHVRAADSARTMQLIWQGTTVAALVSLVGIGITIAFPTPTQVFLHYLLSIPTPDPKLASEMLTDTIYWRGFAARVFLAAALGVLAAYASRQGDKFMEMERKNRKIALEMEALGPFIAPLPKDQQDKFRMDLGSRSFGIPEGEGPRKDEPSPVNLVDVLKSKEVQEAIAKAIKPS